MLRTTRCGTRVVRHPPRQRENCEALYKAAKDGKTEDVRRYIGMGVNVDWQNPDYVRVCLEGIANEKKLTRGNPAPCSPRLSPARAQYYETPLTWAAGNGHVAVVELLLAAGAQINRRTDVRVPPPPRARRALPRSRPPPAPSRARERAPPTLEGGARFGSRDPLGERAAPRRESESENLPPPRFAPALFADDVARARVARAEREDPAVLGSPLWPP